MAYSLEFIGEYAFDESASDSHWTKIVCGTDVADCLSPRYPTNDFWAIACLLIGPITHWLFIIWKVPRQEPVRVFDPSLKHCPLRDLTLCMIKFPNDQMSFEAVSQMNQSLMVCRDLRFKVIRDNLQAIRPSYLVSIKWNTRMCNWLLKSIHVMECSLLVG